MKHWKAFVVFSFICCDLAAANAVVCNETILAAKEVPAKALTRAVLQYQNTKDLKIRDEILLKARETILRPIAHASRFRSIYYSAEDLISVGTLLLYQAIEKYDASKYSTFKNYVSLYVGSRLKDLLQGKPLTVPGTSRFSREKTLVGSNGLEELEENELIPFPSILKRSPVFRDPIFERTLHQLKNSSQLTKSDRFILEDMLSEEFENDVDYAIKRHLKRETYASMKFRLLKKLRALLDERATGYLFARFAESTRTTR